MYEKQTASIAGMLERIAADFGGDEPAVLDVIGECEQSMAAEHESAIGRWIASTNGGDHCARFHGRGGWRILVRLARRAHPNGPDGAAHPKDYRCVQHRGNVSSAVADHCAAADPGQDAQRHAQDERHDET